MLNYLDKPLPCGSPYKEVRSYLLPRKNANMLLCLGSRQVAF